MRRRALGEGDDAVTLLPFLAVLICTMGSLIVLLIVVMQQARDQGERDLRVAEDPPPWTTTIPLPNSLAAARQRESSRTERTADDVPPVPSTTPLAHRPESSPSVATAEPTPQAADIQALDDQHQQLEWEASALELSRDKTQERLREERLALSHIEDHTRRLAKQLKELEEEAQRLEQVMANAAAESVDENELATMRDELGRVRAEIEVRQGSAPAAPSRFAIIPYQGPHPTSQRPIYLECRNDAVIIHPEGIVLTADQLEVLAGHVSTAAHLNPLAAALRAAREYYASGDDDAPPPYPLLIVRPSGIEAYMRARVSLSSWEDEFGYELVEEDRPLAFPPPDPRLADIYRKSVAAATAQVTIRRRLMDTTRQATSQGFRVSRNGGFERSDGSNLHAERSDPFDELGRGRSDAGDADASRQELAGASSNPYADGFRELDARPGIAADYGDGTMPPSNGTWGNVAGGTQLAGSDGATNAGTGNQASDTSGTGYREDGTDFYESGPEYREDGRGDLGPADAGDADAQGANLSSAPLATENRAYASGAADPNSGPSSAGDAPTGVPYASRPVSIYDDPAPPGAPSTATAPADSSGQSPASSALGAGSRGSSSSPPDAAAAGNPNGAASIQFGNKPPPDSGPAAAQSMAAEHGAGWATQDVRVGDLALTRPVHVRCRPGQFVLMADSRYGQPDVVINTVGGTRQSVGSLVAAIQQRMKSWATAGPGTYWSPVLTCHVDAAGKPLFDELSVLLKDSGLEVTQVDAAQAKP
ncbi:MAG: hypothetical protein KDA60_12360 [Planctomycetales bacterium]|nr:hypothetical protein [Planctomycetales bacterium]